MLLNDAKISDFFRITNVFGQIYEKKRNNLSEANARYIFFVFFYHLISNIGNGYIVLLL